MSAVRFTAALVAGVAFAGLIACSSSTSGTPRSTLPSLPPLTLPAVPTAPASTATTSAAPAVSLPDACSLLTRKEAEIVAGVKLRPGEDTKARDPMTDTASCFYDAPVTGSSGSVQIYVQHDVPRPLKVDKAIGHKFHSVPGIGDQALEEDNNIFFRSGEVWIFINSAYGATPAHLEAAAKKMAARLPKS